MRNLLLCAVLPLLALCACDGDFDQRQDDAETVRAGGGSTGSLSNPTLGEFVRGTVSTGGAVGGATVILRPINPDAGVNWDNNSVLGTGTTFSNGIYHVYMLNDSYRGPILVEVRGGGGATGGNPATSASRKLHDMDSPHVLYSVVPLFDGYSVTQVDVSPLTSVAVARCLSLDGSIAGVTGGISTGMFGLMCQQTAEFFGLGRIRARIPSDYAASGAFGNDDLYGRVMAALSQLAKNIGVINVFDFYAGLYEDALDDGELNGSIAVVPNTPIAMPDLGQAGLIGSALRDDYMDPLNLERATGGDNTQITTGGPVDLLITALDAVRDIDNAVRDYDNVVRVVGSVTVAQGGTYQTRIEALDQIGGGIDFHPYGDSAGPSFVEFNWVSSSPVNVSVQPYGLITVNPAAPKGTYTLTLTIQPLAGQTFVTGPTEVHTVKVKVK
ncbi:MAG: hypothetical protein K8I27_07020 [Planctomycetes bacterium]|nr:hypothetical protein [Planctomycetota bacterium]